MRLEEILQRTLRCDSTEATQSNTSRMRKKAATMLQVARCQKIASVESHLY